MSLFETFSDMSKQHAENSGSYTFSSHLLKGNAICGHTCGCTTAEQCEFSKPVEPEPAPTVSLYNLLDHSEADLRRLLVAVREHVESIETIQLPLSVTYKSICAWAALIESALRERELRDSEAWATHTAREIKQTLS